MGRAVIKKERPGTNKWLSEGEELAVSLYLDRLEAIGMYCCKEADNHWLGERYSPS